MCIILSRPFSASLLTILSIFTTATPLYPSQPQISSSTAYYFSFCFALNSPPLMTFCLKCHTALKKKKRRKNLYPKWLLDSAVFYKLFQVAAKFFVIPRSPSADGGDRRDGFELGLGTTEPFYLTVKVLSAEVSLSRRPNSALMVNQ